MQSLQCVSLNEGRTDAVYGEAVDTVDGSAGRAGLQLHKLQVGMGEARMAFSCKVSDYVC